MSNVLDLSSLSELNTDRVAIYHLLASLYDREITPQTAALLNFEIGVPEECSTPAEQKMVSGMKKMADMTHHFDKNREDLLACDFARSFLAAGMCEGNPAVPFESVYTSDEGLMMQEARDDVRRIFKQSGLMPTSEGNIPEDHLSFELEYLARVGEQINDFLSVGDTDTAASLLNQQHDFFEHHLINWFDDFARAVREVSTTEFYEGLLEFTEGFLEWDQKNFQVLEGAFQERPAVPCA